MGVSNSELSFSTLYLHGKTQNTRRVTAVVCNYVVSVVYWSRSRALTLTHLVCGESCTCCVGEILYMGERDLWTRRGRACDRLSRKMAGMLPSASVAAVGDLEIHGVGELAVVGCCDCEEALASRSPPSSLIYPSDLSTAWTSEAVVVYLWRLSGGRLVVLLAASPRYSVRALWHCAGRRGQLVEACCPQSRAV